jgi:hypothetical protein
MHLAIAPSRRSYRGRSVTPNPSIERTLPGKPGAASHVKRLGTTSRDAVLVI